MARVTAPAKVRGPVERRSERTPLALAAALVACAVVVRLFGSAGIPWLSNLLLVFTSLFLQAFPFVVLGAAVSAAIEAFAPGSVLARLARIPRGLRLPAAGAAGLAFPLCECGSVPVARRLAARGLPTSSAVTFMLAASIFNPIVIASTAIAYRGRSGFLIVVVGRAVLGLAIAILAGWVVGERDRRAFLKRPLRENLEAPHEPAIPAFFHHLSADVVFMARYLVLGAFGAAAIQTFVPQTVISSVAGTPVLDLLAMMALAGVLSLCSESDAFVAASFVQFSPAAQLAFLVFGPLFNLKLAALYGGTFSRGFIRTVLAVVLAGTLVGTLWVEVFFR